MRNLASCIKAAIDFVSPESFQHVLELTQERRMLTLQEAILKPEEAKVAPAERRHADKLQVNPFSPWQSLTGVTCASWLQPCKLVPPDIAAVALTLHTSACNVLIPWTAHAGALWSQNGMC